MSSHQQLKLQIIVLCCTGHLPHHQNEGRRLLRCYLHLRPRHASGVRRGGGGDRCPRGQSRQG